MLRLNHELNPKRAVFGELIEPEVCGAGVPACESEPTNPAGPENLNTSSSSTTQRIDEVVVTYFAKPHSYTADDIVEISAHGSPIVLRHVVEIALSRGPRLAAPGAFTRRALVNGRIDLTQAEAERDLIDSQPMY